MRELSLNPFFLEAAKKILYEEFSVDRLTASYLSLKECPHRNKKSARQFIYRTMLRLLKNDDLGKQLDKGAWPVYRFTRKFQLQLSRPNSVPNIECTESSSSSGEVKTRLKERLQLLKMELLTAMGEVEEYSVLENEIPDIRAEVRELADESSDRCSKLLGKVKAIETLLHA